jgi:hypothetical protein
MKGQNKMENPSTWLRPVPEIPASEFYVRCLWVVVRLIAAYWFANKVSPFFYQQF